LKGIRCLPSFTEEAQDIEKDDDSKIFSFRQEKPLISSHIDCHDYSGHFSCSSLLSQPAFAPDLTWLGEVKVNLMQAFEEFS
jgi:hypothetical protein